MNIVFDNEGERGRILEMLNTAMMQIDIDLENRIEDIGIKNILTFFNIKCEGGAVQAMRDITPRAKRIAAPAGRPDHE